MIVVTDRLDDETLRLHEYSPGLDPERYVAHERFIVEGVCGWARERFGMAPPGGRRAVFGVSAGAELALAAASDAPTFYGAILCACQGAVAGRLPYCRARSCARTLRDDVHHGPGGDCACKRGAVPSCSIMTINPRFLSWFAVQLCPTRRTSMSICVPSRE
jgi:hypothetical protein